MSIHCCKPPERQLDDKRYSRVLWAVLIINTIMFFIEVGAGFAAGSVSLQADALDFLGDAANYGISLFVVGMALRYRALAALLKGLTMWIFGVWVLGTTIWHITHGTTPDAYTMCGVGFIALLANIVCFALLWAYRAGDSNMRSVWLCSRNDVLSNIAVLLAAWGVFGTATAWPDMIVGVVMAALALQGSYIVVKHALLEFRNNQPAH